MSRALSFSVCQNCLPFIENMKQKQEPPVRSLCIRVRTWSWRIRPPVCYLSRVTGIRGKIVLVAGASGGIGEAIATEFARAGAFVVVSSRNEEKLQTLVKRLRHAGSQALALCCDVADRKQVVALGAMTAQKAGTVQILINSAGIAPAVGFLEMADAVWDDVLRVNLTGTYNCCKTFLPGMIQSGWGRIINVASTTAKVAYSHISAYTTSKHGVLGLTRSLALETAKRGVTVNAICPGYVDTELTRENARRMAEKTGKTTDAILQLFAESSPQKRLIAPEEVAGLALMLASEKAGGITGQAINVDGGAVMV
ncbi:MAG TPA: SDR family NAD(P)-dependent oxidoreductase [Candidatus Binatia bacterium]